MVLLSASSSLAKVAGIKISSKFPCKGDHTPSYRNRGLLCDVGKILAGLHNSFEWLHKLDRVFILSGAINPYLHRRCPNAERIAVPDNNVCVESRFDLARVAVQDPDARRER